jgi:predicted nuclease of restriction endonuclease-like RecB superfamily
MTVWASDDFKTILRYAKLARLMPTITRRGLGDYVIRLTGPASVLRATRRYGGAMARFLPALVACRGWRMHAVIRTRRRGWAVALDLSSDDGLTSHLPPPREFDSLVEESFAAKWGPEKREGWQLVREGEILHHRQKVFVPDFLFRHDDGRRVLMEIVGFWTPEYLEAKLATLRSFAGHRILLAVASPARETLPDLSADAIPYKSALRVKDVLDRLEERPVSD